MIEGDEVLLASFVAGDAAEGVDDGAALLGFQIERAIPFAGRQVRAEAAGRFFVEDVPVGRGQHEVIDGVGVLHGDVPEARAMCGGVEHPAQAFQADEKAESADDGDDDEAAQIAFRRDGTGGGEPRGDQPFHERHVRKTQNPVRPEQQAQHQRRHGMRVVEHDGMCGHDGARAGFKRGQGRRHAQGAGQQADDAEHDPDNHVDPARHKQDFRRGAEDGFEAVD